MTNIGELPEVQYYEQSAGVPAGFFVNLLNEDDWSFVIKLHAFIEAVATQTIVEHLQEPDLVNYVSRLGLQSGKMRMLSDLGLIGKPVRRFMTSLATLRNSLVHDVRNTQFDMASSFSGMSESKLKTEARNLSCFRFLTPEPKPLVNKRLFKFEIDEDDLALLKEKPKLFIFLGTLSLLNSQFDMRGYSEWKQYEKATRALDDGDA